MKKVLAFIMVLLPLALCAQVRVVSAPKQERPVEKYDSTNNVPRFQITGMVGQELFLPPRPDHLKEYGYQDIYRTATSYTGSIPCEEIAGHSFKIVSIEEYEKLLYYFNLKLEDTQTGTNYFYTYSVTQSSWPFITLGYKAKYEALNKGKSFVSLSYSLGKDFNTGQYILGQSRGSVWVFQEIIANQDNGEIGYLYSNDKGQAVVVSERSLEGMRPKAEIDNLRKKYGSYMCDTALEGTVKIGMPADLVIIAKGRPKSINNASYGSQWVYGEYGDDCIYFKNGKVTGWN